MRDYVRFASILLLLLAAVSAAAGAFPSVSTEPVEVRIDRYLRSEFPADAPGAAVLVSRNGRVIVRSGYGLADLATATPVEPDMAFRIGSISKTFTAAAILDLIDEGALSLQSDVREILPDYVAPQSITIEQLLTHTSGIANYTTQRDFPSIMTRRMSPRALTDWFERRRAEFAPGAAWSYNNSGYLLLGRVVEELAARPFAAHLDATVVRRAGLSRTVDGRAERHFVHRAHGYETIGGRHVEAPPLDMSIPFGAASLVSTVDDLEKWTRAFVSGRVVSPEMTERALTPHRISGRSTRYGFGWNVTEIEGRRVVGHSGDINGYASDMIYLPDEDLFIAVLSNDADHPRRPSRITMEIASMITGVVIDPEPVRLDPWQLRRLAGNYAMERDGDATIDVIGGQLLLKTRDSTVALQPSGTREFFLPGTFFRVTFDLDRRGRPIAMVASDRYGPDRVAMPLQ